MKKRVSGIKKNERSNDGGGKRREGGIGRLSLVIARERRCVCRSRPIEEAERISVCSTDDDSIYRAAEQSRSVNAKVSQIATEGDRV